MSASRPGYQLKIGEWIVKAEGRRDAAGNLRVYQLPKGDGGGKYEVAGINDRYHPSQAAWLRELIEAGKQAEAEALAVGYILGYTDVVAPWAMCPAIEVFLRDCAFNRGPGGAAKILQIALEVAVDGHVGPVTRQAALHGVLKPSELLQSLRNAREAYERIIAPPVGARAKFWNGLVNRWDAAFLFAKTLL